MSVLSVERKFNCRDLPTLEQCVGWMELEPLADAADDFGIDISDDNYDRIRLELVNKLKDESLMRAIILGGLVNQQQELMAAAVNATDCEYGFDDYDDSEDEDEDADGEDECFDPVAARMLFFGYAYVDEEGQLIPTQEMAAFLYALDWEQLSADVGRLGTFNRYALGAANLYGVLSVVELVNLINTVMDEPPMKPSKAVELYKQAEQFLDGYDIRNGYIVHIDLLENNAYLQMIEDIKHIPLYLPQELDDLALSGYDEDFPYAFKPMDDLVRLLRPRLSKAERCDGMPYAQIDELFRRAKKGDELLPLPEAQMLLSCLKTNQQKARFRALLKEMEDGARRWEYRGHSAAEMRALELL
ncbi:hypothetical protein [Agathobaculum desmolans]|uniref:hypothetical protein n=1 Tax=Agathobaculum desmolans TaxID=39484 RepID=UPI00248EF4B1|nr:hypothetical protein [Agathobaculum desmolans]